MIDSFDGEYSFLSNFYQAEVEFNGMVFLNNEAAYQAQKVLTDDEKKEFIYLQPAKAKKKGRFVNLRPDWEDIKKDIMYQICFNKFMRHPELTNLLIQTKEEELIEGNYWHDNFWGNCTCEKCKDKIGENNLGKILMRIRDELGG